MAHLLGIRIGKKAGALAAALALGAAILSLSASPAHAAPAEADDIGELCDMVRRDGHIDFYLPGESARDNYGHWKYCGDDGQWHSPVRTQPSPQGPRVRGGGFR